MSAEHKRDECNCCGYKTELTRYPGETMAEIKGEVWLCGLCAGTMAGRSWRYQEGDSKLHILKAICFVGNAILEALSKNRG